ncbi:hypothetical protein [Hyalangium sp.]|uniref:hypothetical protein n=1 Tax=Hyalangium sp. TaxID=2028555 RepID=UPI002D757A04|nr:hypothetical protein [Hyalangium sp.]HYH97928.1 hypothetical protein [Hyalangium sp.]
MSQMDWGGTGYGADCALHPDQRATRTCTRCGNFMCASCSQEGSQEICPTCQERVGVGQAFPLTRDNWSFSALWDYCFTLFKRDWLMLSVAMLVFLGISLISQLMSTLVPTLGAALGNKILAGVLQAAAVFVQSVVNGVLGLGLMRMLIDVLQGGKLDIGQLFSQFHRVGTYIVTMLLLIVMIGVPVGAIGGIAAGVVFALGQDALPFVIIIAALLLIVPLFYFALPLYLLQAEIAYNETATPMQMIRNCYAYARGERLSILGVSLVGGLVVMAGVLACCVGMIPAMGLNYLMLAGLYLALRRGADVEG